MEKSGHSLCTFFYFSLFVLVYFLEHWHVCANGMRDDGIRVCLEYIYSDDDSANECSTTVYGELYRVGWLSQFSA